MGIKRPKTKKFSSRHNDGEEIVENIKQNTIKNTFMNFRIHNKFKLNEVHKNFFDLLMLDDTKMGIIDGPAGSAKSYLSVYAGLQLLKDRKISQIIYIRAAVESASKSLGFLPGSDFEKMAPYKQPLDQKLEELVGNKVAEELYKNDFIKCVPVNFTRGLTFRDSLVIVDEIQSMTLEEITTILTRFGENSKYVLIGDSFQSDIGNKSGFKKIQTVFNDKDSTDKGIYTFEFTENEVVRSEILKFIVKKLELNKKREEYIRTLKHEEQKATQKRSELLLEGEWTPTKETPHFL